MVLNQEFTQVQDGRTISIALVLATSLSSQMAKRTSLPLSYPTIFMPHFLNYLPLTVVAVQSILAPFMPIQLDNTTPPSPLKTNSCSPMACSSPTLSTGPYAKKTMWRSSGKSNTSAPTTPKPHKLLAASGSSKSLYRLKDWLCTKAQSDSLLPMPSPAFVAALTATCTKPPISKAREDAGLKLLFVTAPYIPGAKTTTRCAIGAVRQATTLRSATPSATADTVYNAAMTASIASALMTFAMSLRTAKSIPLTPTSNVATALLLTMTLTSEGC